jgi:hypothetical protein
LLVTKGNILKITLKPEAAAIINQIVARKMKRALEAGAIDVKHTAPIDTSSYESSIRVPPIQTTESGKLHGQILAGGVDYSGQIMPTTGKEGKRVDYARDIEARTGNLAGAWSTVQDELEG